MKHETLVPDDLWEAIEPYLPKEPPKPKGGRACGLLCVRFLAPQPGDERVAVGGSGSVPRWRGGR